MPISHRLHGPINIRPDEGIQEAPKRIVFLSVEGNKTEKNYFCNVDKHREQLGIHSLVHVETLSRYSKDTRSSPSDVYELLTEYIDIRKDGILPEEILDVLKNKDFSYSVEYLSKYLNGELPDRDARKLQAKIERIGIDLDYHKFLSAYKGDQGEDVFAVMIDRDSLSHSEEEILKLIEDCKDNGYKCFISTPCFEFWLLLHVCDVKEEYKDKLGDILENRKVTSSHTFVSKELSQKANHGKTISEKAFKENYLDNIDIAIERAKQFEQTERGLINKLGSNIPELFKILREPL